MLKEKNSVADYVMVEMADIMESDEFRSVMEKTAAKKDDKKKEKEDKEKAKAKKEKEKAKADKNKADDKKKKEKAKKNKKSEAEQFRLVVEGTAKISEILDELGLVKSATLALQTLEEIVVEAKKKGKGKKKKDDEDKKEDEEKDEDSNDAEDSEDEDEDSNDAEDDDEEDENDAEDMEEGCADDCMADDGKDEEKDAADANDVEDLKPPPPAPNRPMPEHEVKAPTKSTTPASGYSKPQAPAHKHTPDWEQKKTEFQYGNADDSEAGELDEDKLLSELGLSSEDMPEEEGVSPEEMEKIREELGGLFAEENDEHDHKHDDEPGSLFDTYAEVSEALLSLGAGKKWLQKAIKKPGRFEGWSLKKMKNRYNKLKDKEDKSKEEKSEMRALGLGIRLKGNDVPGGKRKKGL